MKSFFAKPFFTEKKYIASIWLLASILVVLKQYFRGNFNNYKIFRQVFYHVIDQLPLYKEYPLEYFDHNHYGPIFSLVIAPFALLPDYLGVVLWGVFNAGVLIWAIAQLPLRSTQITAILWICLNELITNLLHVQFNPLMTALIILSFVFVKKEKDFWAVMCIALGAFVKLYGIVGLAFFFFSKHKTKFIISLLFWSLLFFVLPMLISSPEYILNTYVEWYERLVAKNSGNVRLGNFQDISLMGMVRRFLNNAHLSNVPFLIFGLVLFGAQYLRIKKFGNDAFQLLILSSTLIFTVIFSSGSESPTYIIAFFGVAIWFVIQPFPIHWRQISLFVFAMILTSFSTTDLIPKYIKWTYVIPYSLKALPCVLIWFSILYETYTNKLDNYHTSNIK